MMSMYKGILDLTCNISIFLSVAELTCDAMSETVEVFTVPLVLVGVTMVLVHALFLAVSSLPFLLPCSTCSAPLLLPGGLYLLLPLLFRTPSKVLTIAVLSPPLPIVSPPPLPFPPFCPLAPLAPLPPLPCAILRTSFVFYYENTV